jgi:hypothetical protein
LGTETGLGQGELGVGWTLGPGDGSPNLSP